MSALNATAHEHHERLLPGVAAMLETAEMVGSVPCEELRPHVLANRDFLNGLLLPHMEAAEKALYPALAQVLADPRAMAPMSREHAEIRTLTADLDRLCGHHREGAPYTPGEAIELRRVLFRLYAIVKVHLVEEEHYLKVLSKNLTSEETAQLAGALEHAGRVAL